MSELQNYYNNVASGSFANPNRELCGCRGGWFLSQVDTWHKCPYHDHDARHPEDDYDCDDSDCDDSEDEAVEVIEDAMTRWYVQGIRWTTVFHERELDAVVEGCLFQLVLNDTTEKWDLACESSRCGGFDTANEGALYAARNLDKIFEDLEAQRPHKTVTPDYNDVPF